MTRARFAAPALAAGNAALLKHAPSVTSCAVAAEEVFRATAASVGAPTALFTTLLVDEADVLDVTARVTEHPLVAAVTLTGSERAGTPVAAIAAGALKKTVLGQSCLAAKRFIVRSTGPSPPAPRC